MIAAKAISKKFGRIRAVDAVSFDLEPGQIAGLLGPNGAGKSTTIRMITGFVCPDAGRVTINGFDTTANPMHARQRIGYLPESAPAYPEMRAMDYLVFRARLCGIPRRQARLAAQKASEQCHLDPANARKRIAALSKGYRQRVGLAAAIVHDPSVLILDEPTNGLDPGQIREARSLIRQLAHGRTMLVSSHILPEIERTCDRVIIIAGGRIRADGSPSQLAEHLPLELEIEYCPPPAADPLSVPLGELDGIQGLNISESSDGWKHIRAHCTPTTRDAVAQLVHASGVPVRTLSIKPPSLEDVFVQVTQTDDGVRS